MEKDDIVFIFHENKLTEATVKSKFGKMTVIVNVPGVGIKALKKINVFTPSQVSNIISKEQYDE